MRIALVVVLCLTVRMAEAGQAALTGVVKDATGGVVSGAAVSVRNATGVAQQTVSGPDGRFSLSSAPNGQSELVVRAVGFAEASRPLSGGGDLEIVLLPATLTESITVTPSRTEQRLGDVPATVNVIDREVIRRSPAVVADDVLRLVPTFSLFRRTSSLSSHPTTQGVSLRGIGPSGVSRSLVLMDGVPFNDPFGGWVYWTRIPLDAVDRIEVVEGTGSNVYGNYAMGGVINIMTARPKPRTFEMRTQYGNHNSPKADFFASDVWGKVGASIEGSFFDTDGFPIVASGERGPIDTKATVTYQNVVLKMDYSPTSNVSAFVRGGYFREDRHNAKFSTFDNTPEVNDTLWKNVSGGVRVVLPDQSDLQARVFTDFERFDSSFIAVPNPVTRAVGRTSFLQRVPTSGVGAVAQWAKPVSARHLISAGIDWRRVEGASHETFFDTATGTTFRLFREAGGSQQSTGGYVQGQFWPMPRLSLTLSGRIDRWRNYDARNLETGANGLPTADSRLLAEKDDTAFSPRAAAIYHLTDRVSVWGSLGGGFRAPTLNELYRQFQVGQTLTRANDQLGPERLVGGEVGVNLAPSENLTVRSTWYDNRVKNPVSNVSIGTSGAVTIQQRQNLGRTRIWGLQSDAEYRFASDWRVGGAYMFNQAKVEEFSANTFLEGKYLPQVPKHRGSVNVAYVNPRFATVSVSALFFGRQFDDDRNERIKAGESEPGLPGYGVVEFTVLRSLSRNLDVFLGVQNLFDEEYYVMLQPTTVGSPRLVNAGFRVRFAGR